MWGLFNHFMCSQLFSRHYGMSIYICSEGNNIIMVVFAYNRFNYVVYQEREYRIEWGQFWPMGPNQSINLCHVLGSLNLATVRDCATFHDSRTLSMSLTLSCLSNKFSCFSRVTLYIEHAISRRYLSSTRFSLHTLHIFVFAWWLYDTTSKPNLCVRVRRSVNALREPRQPKTVMSYQGNIYKPFRLS